MLRFVNPHAFLVCELSSALLVHAHQSRKEVEGLANVPRDEFRIAASRIKKDRDCLYGGGTVLKEPIDFAGVLFALLCVGPVKQCSKFGGSVRMNVE